MAFAVAGLVALATYLVGPIGGASFPLGMAGTLLLLSLLSAVAEGVLARYERRLGI